MSSAIIKIRALDSHIASDDAHLSFRKGQAFYALSADHVRSLYFVSTHFSTPFCRNAVCGWVPMELFETDGADSKSIPRRITGNERLTGVQIVAYMKSGSQLKFHIKVHRGNLIHYIDRTIEDFTTLHKWLSLQLGTLPLPIMTTETDSILEQTACLADYLAGLLSSELACQSIPFQRFFAPRSEKETQVTKN
jgi:hypothetical protein